MAHVVFSQRHPQWHPLILICLVVLSDIHFVILEIIQACLFLHDSVWWYYHGKLYKWTSFGPAVGLSMRKRTSHTHMGTQSHWTHTCTEGISACLCFEAAMPELPVLLNPILKERFTPHVWEAPGIGRECTHKGTYTNKICMPDAMFNHWSKLTHLDTWNGIAVCLLLLVKQYFNTSAVVYYKQQ